MTKKICLTSDLRNCTSYDCGFWYTCKMMIFPAIFIFIFFFFHYFQNSDFSGFSKFITKCQKEILRCAHLLHMFMVFFTKWWPFKNYERCFLFRIKSSFHSWDIHIFVIVPFSTLFRFKKTNGSGIIYVMNWLA